MEKEIHVKRKLPPNMEAIMSLMMYYELIVKCDILKSMSLLSFELWY